MNHDGANQESIDAGGNPGEMPTNRGTDAEVIPAEAIQVVQPSTPIRIGSPFAVDPAGILPAKPVEIFYDVGPLRYTAMGAVAAATMVVGFALAAVLWFPTGGALIAGLGCLLSIFGLYSSYRKTALLLLLIHLSIFVLTYFRSLA